MNLDLEALETSFDLVAPRGDELMDVFYARLFAAAPGGEAALRRHRPAAAEDDAARHARPAAQVAARTSTRSSRSSASSARATSRYGAQPEHYPVVGEALIASMAEIAGDAWTPEYDRAWTQAFELVAGAMIEGAQSATLAAAA